MTVMSTVWSTNIKQASSQSTPPLHQQEQKSQTQNSLLKIYTSGMILYNVSMQQAPRISMSVQ